MSMKKGDKVRVWASPEASETAQHMVYELELVGVAKQVTPPDSLQGPPPEATVHESGMAYMVLNDAPTSGEKPRPRARVSTHLTVWDTNGQTLQTTQSTGKPQTIALKALPPGVSAGMQMMDAGDKYRMWVPQELTAESPARRADTGLCIRHRVAGDCRQSPSSTIGSGQCQSTTRQRHHHFRRR